MKVSVIIPVYNEATVIGATISRIKELHPDFDILVINDGSSDATAKEAEKNGARVISHPYNIGNGAAVKTGVRNATGDYVVLMDGDGQHRPEDIHLLLKWINEYDLVVGSRDIYGQATFARSLANWCYNKMATFITSFPVKDLTSGFRIFKRETLIQFLPLLPNSFSYPTTITLAYLRNGYTLKYIPITVMKRKGKSKIKLLSDGSRFVLIMVRIATLYSPLKIFLPVSLLFFILGLCNYGYSYAVSGRFTNMSALLLSMGIITFLMGMISEQITQVHYDKASGNFFNIEKTKKDA